MRNLVVLGAVILFAGSVGVAVAQERLPQGSSGSAFGVGAGVGDVSGSAGRTQSFDRNAFLDRLSQPETIYGRVLAIDVPGRKIHLETGGSSHDEGRAGSGALSEVRAYLDDHTNVEQLKVVGTGDDVIVTVVEATSSQQPFGTGRKLVREITVLRGNEQLAGFGGLGQRPDPKSERGINAESAGGTGGVVGQVMPGEVKTGIASSIGEMTGAAPCWQCEPQPGWGYGTSTKSDYGSSDKPQLNKGAQ
ncbi:MAG: hypothetical protein ACREIS_08035 [Nitrospiraceae bacterium]